MAKEKGTSLNAVLGKLRNDFSKTFPNVREAGTVKRIITSSPKLNYIFGGGFPVGRIIELFGPESGGKTVLASYLAGQVQQRKDGGPKTILFIDFEKTFDWKYAEIAGMNCSDEFLIYMDPLTGEEAFTNCQSLVETGEIGAVIIDSVAAVPTAASMEDEYNKAGFGQTAKLFSDGLRKLNPYLSRYQTSMILINQVRDKIGGFASYGPNETTNGGRSIKFYASWRARVSKVEDIMNKEEIIGNTIKVKNVKSKIGYPKRSAELNLLYGSGFNPDAEYIDFMVQLGMVEKKGGWYSNEEWGLKVQGQDKLLPYLYEHPDRFEEVKTTVNNMFGSFSALDAAESDNPESDGEEVDE